MTATHGFELVREKDIPELKTKAFLYSHIKTGAELMSLVNDDENKVFGITFRTPPLDSTGLPHILEHSVLCGSRKYPVKDPFVQMVKGSLQTFLNAMTYPDKTCYPVASQNLKDFYNLVDVYLDAVFYPRLTRHVFQQEGWHYDLEGENDTLKYNGIVFNEMKGAYSSPDSLLSKYSMMSLFPDTPYGLNSGGDPKDIPNLTFEQFRDFHAGYYHPSNSRIFFYGDDDPGKRLSIANEYLKEFDRRDVGSSPALQKPFTRSTRVIRSYAAAAEGPNKGMLTLNWMFDRKFDSTMNLALSALEYILLGMPGSPLRKVMIESGLGEDLAGSGLGSEIRQFYFSTGLKGIDLENSDRIQNMLLQTLTRLSREGIDPHNVEAAMNRLEFSLRENNTGSHPRGLMLMLRSLTAWLYDEDPLSLIAFEAPLQELKFRIDSNKRFFEGMIEELFLENPHRVTLILKPDPDLSEKEIEAEKNRLISVREKLNTTDMEGIRRDSAELRKIQATPDTQEALASIPLLKLSDLDRENKIVPLETIEEKGARIFYHDLFTNGIIYMDTGFDIHALPGKYIPYVHLFGRALLEMGTEKDDYARISQRINRKTGGIRPSFLNSMTGNKGEHSASWIFLRSKAMPSQFGDMLEIIKDLVLNVKLDNKDRFKQMVLEAKAREEEKLAQGGHQIINLRLRSHFSEAGWAAEQMSGVSYLFFLRDLAEKTERAWPDVLADLNDMRRILVNRNRMLLNFTVDGKNWSRIKPDVDEFLGQLPVSDTDMIEWTADQADEFEGLTIPSQVNYVGKGANLYRLGYDYHGSVHVISRLIRNSWLYEQIRVQGGAYGSFCMFDRLSGDVTFVSYRDPNIFKTIDAYDQTADYLRKADLNDDEITKGIIGSIGDIDGYKLPDAKGYASMAQRLCGVTDEERQKMREQILDTREKDFRAFADILDAVKDKGIVKVLGSENNIQGVEAKKPGWLKVLKVM
jgi:Zn-dependent M16 (insulinase) family peptidase